MSDLKMQIAFANILRKKTEAGAVAPAVPSVDATRGARAASEQREAVTRELAKRSTGSPRSVGTIRAKR